MKENIYTYLDSKKIYLATTKGKYLLVEKKVNSDAKKSLSLSSRKTTIINKDNKILIFPKNN